MFSICRSSISNRFCQNDRLFICFIDFFRNAVSGIVGDIYGMFVNVLTQFQKLIIKLKDTMMKIIGIVTLLVIFWPIMSTGSFLKNWNMIFICYLVGIVFGLKTKEFKSHK